MVTFSGVINPDGGNRHLLSWKSQHFAFTLDKGLLSLHTMFPSRDRKMIPLNQKLRVLPRFFGLLMPLNQQEKKFGTVLDGMIDPTTKGKLNC